MNLGEKATGTGEMAQPGTSYSSGGRVPSSSQLPVTPSPGDLVPSAGHCGLLQIRAIHKYIYMRAHTCVCVRVHTYIHKFLVCFYKKRKYVFLHNRQTAVSELDLRWNLTIPGLQTPGFLYSQ